MSAEKMSHSSYSELMNLHTASLIIHAMSDRFFVSPYIIMINFSKTFANTDNARENSKTGYADRKGKQRERERETRVVREA